MEGKGQTPFPGPATRPSNLPGGEKGAQALREPPGTVPEPFRMEAKEILSPLRGREKNLDNGMD